jgi:large subunit ribosomal protein L17
MLVVALIKDKSIKTTVQKAKVARQAAEKMVTLARKNTLAARRLAAARLHDEGAVTKLFSEIVPMQEGRPCGFTRIVKLGQRTSDGSEMAVLSWVQEKYEPKAAATEPAVEA